MLGIMSSFGNRCCKLSLDTIVGSRSEKIELKQEFCQWIRPENSLAESMAVVKDGFTWWLPCLDFPPTSILRFFALKLLSIAAGAADLERVWSATRFCMSPKKSRLFKRSRTQGCPDQDVDQRATSERTGILWAGTEPNREPEEVDSTLCASDEEI